MLKHEPEIPEDVRKLADWMLQELQDNKLTVILIDAPRPMFEGHKIRAVQIHNPEWYQEQGLDRKLSVIALNRIRFGLPLSSKTDFRVLDIVENELRNIYGQIN